MLNPDSCDTLALAKAHDICDRLGSGHYVRGLHFDECPSFGYMVVRRARGWRRLFLDFFDEDVVQVHWDVHSDRLHYTYRPDFQSEMIRIGFTFTSSKE